MQDLCVKPGSRTLDQGQGLHERGCAVALQVHKHGCHQMHRARHAKQMQTEQSNSDERNSRQARKQLIHQRCGLPALTSCTRVSTLYLLASAMLGTGCERMQSDKGMHNQLRLRSDDVMPGHAVCQHIAHRNRRVPPAHRADLKLSSCTVSSASSSFLMASLSARTHAAQRRLK